MDNTALVNIGFCFLGFILGLGAGILIQKVQSGSYDAKPEKDPLAKEWENQSKGYK